MYTIGSFRLGVNAAGGDVDMVVVTPRCITRDMFFTAMLAKLRGCPRVTELNPVPNTYVPVIKFYFDGVDIDLLFAQVALNIIPNDFNIRDDSVLTSIDEASQRSMNGARVNDGILELVPNREAFRTTLRFIKFWAKRRGIYSNVFGYPGGVAWAIMTARVCQLFPNLDGAVLVQKFFLTYRVWSWPKAVDLTPRVVRADLRLAIWDEKRSQGDLMPVITPAYPCMNSTFNITVSTKRVLEQELARGEELSRAIGPTLAVSEARALFERIATPTDFYSRYKHYLDVTVSADSAVEMSTWQGFCESRMRTLVALLQNKNPAGGEATTFLRVHPHPVPIEGSSPQELHYYFGIAFDAAKAPLPAGAPTGTKPTLDIGADIAQFTATLMKDDKICKGGMKIAVDFLRAAQLPDTAFPAGRPVAPAKKTVKKAKTAAAAAVAAVAATCADGAATEADVQLPAPAPAIPPAAVAATPPAPMATAPLVAVSSAPVAATVTANSAPVVAAAAAAAADAAVAAGADAAHAAVTVAAAAAEDASVPRTESAVTGAAGGPGVVADANAGAEAGSDGVITTGTRVAPMVITQAAIAAAAAADMVAPTPVADVVAAGPPAQQQLSATEAETAVETAVATATSAI